MISSEGENPQFQYPAWDQNMHNILPGQTYQNNFYVSSSNSVNGGPLTPPNSDTGSDTFPETFASGDGLQSINDHKNNISPQTMPYNSAMTHPSFYTSQSTMYNTPFTSQNINYNQAQPCASAMYYQWMGIKRTVKNYSPEKEKNGETGKI